MRSTRSGPPRPRITGPVLLAILHLFAPAILSAQSGGGDASGAPSARGELVRLPDARADVSVTWPEIGAVPAFAWGRVEGASVALVSGGSARAEAEVRAAVEERMGPSGVRSVGGLADAGPFELEITGDDGIRFFWRDRTEAFAIEVLGEARRAVDDFELTVHMPHAGVIGDMWGLQAELSRAGIRRVRFVAGS